jgi:chorismate synthase
VGPLAGVIAHGGAVGAIVEGLIVVAVSSVLIAVWLRERKAGRERAAGPARLRDDDEARS